MPDWLNALFDYPTAIYTTLMIVALVYWLAAIFGAVDFNHGVHLEVDAGDVGGDIGHDVDIGHADATGYHADYHHDTTSHLGPIASAIVAMGLNGVPFSIALSLLVFFAWAICLLTAQFVMTLVPTELLRMVAATGLLVVSGMVSIMLTARVIRPLRPLFHVHNAKSDQDLIGHSCNILSLHVDEKSGWAEVAGDGAPFNIDIWAATPNTLSKGSRAVVVGFNAASHRYEVVAATE